MIGDRCLRVAHHAFILFLVVATAAVLSAQTVVDPRFVEFSPSADHNTNASDGTPLVQRSSLSVYVVGSSVAFDTMDLGKPTPSGGVIRVDFLPLLHSVPTPGRRVRGARHRGRSRRFNGQLPVEWILVPARVCAVAQRDGAVGWCPPERRAASA